MKKKYSSTNRTFSSGERSQDHTRRDIIQSIDASADASRLGVLLGQYGMGLGAEGLELLARFHGLLIERNRTQNLTRIFGLHEMVLKHYVDSLLVLRYVPFLSSPLMDLGSGAGFPGIVLKIARPELRILLAESSTKKAAFLSEACEVLGLPGLEVEAKRIDGRYRRPVSCVITRAVGSIRDTQERVAGALVRGGRLVLMKGPGVDEEKPDAVPGFEEEMDVAYTLPDGEQRRRLLVYIRRR